jgi:hypothetical protein
MHDRDEGRLDDTDSHFEEGHLAYLERRTALG